MGCGLTVIPAKERHPVLRYGAGIQDFPWALPLISHNVSGFRLKAGTTIEICYPSLQNSRSTRFSSVSCRPWPVMAQSGPKWPGVGHFPGRFPIWKTAPGGPPECHPAPSWPCCQIRNGPKWPKMALEIKKFPNPGTPGGRGVNPGWLVRAVVIPDFTGVRRLP